jgi:hypothetical protein
MRWGFAIPGQPVSWNDGYEIGLVRRTGRAGRLRLGSDGSIIERRTIIKTEAAKAYTDLVTLLARTARPRDWKPDGLVVVELAYYLGADIDCDNVMKFINDGIERATGVNDKWYLPRAMSKQTGLRPHLRRVEVSIEG